MIAKAILIVIWLCLIPFCCGLWITRCMPKKYQNCSMVMVTGFFFVLALFQVVYIPFIVYYNHFLPLVYVFSGIILCFAFFSLCLHGKYFIKNRQPVEQMSWSTYALWMIAIGLIGFQLYMNVFYQFHDGDDADYVVQSVITWQNHNMYMRSAYTGESSLLDVRHAFSSAPVFIAFLAEVTGIHPTIITHVLYSSMILLIFYLIVKLVADLLVDKKYAPFFLILVSLIQIFGNTTIYQNSTFLLTRTAQGKAFLGNIIPTAAILGLLLVRDTYGENPDQNLNQNPNRKYEKLLLPKSSLYAPWIFLSLVMVTAVFTSLMGLLLAGLFIGGTVVLLAIVDRKPILLLRCVVAMLPLGVIGGLYIKFFL